MAKEEDLFLFSPFFNSQNQTAPVCTRDSFEAVLHLIGCKLERAWDCNSSRFRFMARKTQRWKWLRSCMLPRSTKSLLNRKLANLLVHPGGAHAQCGLCILGQNTGCCFAFPVCRLMPNRMWGIRCAPSEEHHCKGKEGSKWYRNGGCVSLRERALNLALREFLHILI